MKTKKLLRTILILFSAIAFTAGITLTSCLNVSGLKEPETKKTSAVTGDTAVSSNSDLQEDEQPDDSISTGNEEPEQKYNIEDMIRVETPKPQDMVSSPLVIKGEARGNWYFEASFPVKLLDADGNIIASYYATAQGEWMIEDFVPFMSELIFETPSTQTGTLILQKDNPSGLEVNDASIEIPVRFAQDKSIIEDMDPAAGEYFAGAILKKIDLASGNILVEQLINEPNEKIISPEVKLANDLKVVKIILERLEEKEIITEITLDDIAIGSEIGIIFRADNTARVIIYQEVIEK